MSPKWWPMSLPCSSIGILYKYHTTEVSVSAASNDTLGSLDGLLKQAEQIGEPSRKVINPTKAYVFGTPRKVLPSPCRIDSVRLHQTQAALNIVVAARRRSSTESLQSLVKGHGM